VSALPVSSPVIRPPAGPRRGPGASPRPATPPLRVAERRATPARAPFVLLVSFLLGAGLIGVLLVNTWLAQGSFTLHQLQLDHSKYADQSQALAQSLAADAAPQTLAIRAGALGMLPAPNPVFKRTADGAVVGVPTRAWPPPPPPPAPSPSAAVSDSATPAPSASASTAGAAAKPSTSVPPATAAKPSTVARPSAAAQPSVSARPSAVAKPSAKPTAAPSGGHG
jgi:hypothetical protein